MKKATIVTLALVLVLAASTFASAANYIGGGIGIIGFTPDASTTATDDTWVEKLPAFTLALDFDVMDKLSVSANGYIKVVEKEAASTTATTTSYDVNYLVGGYAKYALANLDALKLGAVVGVNYNKNFAPNPTPTDMELNYGAGVFAEQPLGETGTIYGQAMYWVRAEEDAPVTDHLGGLGGINFRITDKIAVKGQVEYVNKHALFSIGVGYTF
ncbi:MAG: outer membrane beta-barrel protein [Firmicutes bacterium]|jgi:hypothetical protein|nr:outer membrane beta-barrel protein [Bacillota bacterium]